MGLTKNYLRYVHDSTFGVVAASQVGASIHFLRMRGTKDRYVAVPANEDVIFWDLKTRQIINRLKFDMDNAAEVVTMDCYHGGHPRTNLIAVGYANGIIRVFEYETGVLRTSFTGHRTSISALKFDKDGSRLASGGKDSVIVLWDVVGERGIFSLKGHKNGISKLDFLSNQEHQKDLLISSSIDATSSMKFWDLSTQHCFCTLPGQASGVWSFALHKNGTRLIVGTSSPELRVYSVEFLSNIENQVRSVDDDAVPSELEYGLRVKMMGNVLRNSISISTRIQDILVDPTESFLICHSTDKSVELYGLRSDDEALKYAKKQAKKQVRRATKRKSAAQADDNFDDSVAEPTESGAITSLNSLSNQSRVDCEYNKKLGSFKLSDKIRSLAVAKTSTKNPNQFRVAIMCASNRITYHSLDPFAEDKTKVFNDEDSIESLSHRTDVRAIAISPDCSLTMSSSAESIKIWRSETLSCIATIESEYATCCTFADAQHLSGLYKNRFALVGTKQGNLEIIDLSESKIVKVYTITEGSKPLTSICVLPDKTGIVVGGEDGLVKFFNYTWERSEQYENSNLNTVLAIQEERTLRFQEGITCIKVSPNSNLLAVALLDSTVRVHFIDTLKYFLTMYGHKFPVTALDISDDSTLLITGSPDKNIKIWGLDFGDCHKSIFAHDDAITCVKFVPKTHYAFSSGRDRMIKQWDCDHFIKIQTLKKHQGEVWCLDVSPNGKSVVTGSHDKSLRYYRKTEEILIPSEEEETEREVEDERNVYEKQENVVLGDVNLEAGFAAKMTIETVKSTDKLIEAIDVFGNEQQKEIDHKKACELADAKGEPYPPEPEKDPLLMTAMTTDYRRFMLETMRRIKSSELEEVLLTLPFDYVRRLLMIIVLFLKMRWDIELSTRSATFLLKVNYGQAAACSSLVPVISELRTAIMDCSRNLRDCAGFNMVTLEHLQQNRKYLDTRTSHNNFPSSLY